MLEEFLKKICSELNIEEIPKKDENNVFTFHLNDDVQIWMHELNPGVFAFAHIDTLIREKQEDLFIYLMKANFFGRGTGGGVIGMDREEKFLTLSLAIPYEINYNLFREKLEDFVNYLIYWREESENYRKMMTETLL